MGILPKKYTKALLAWFVSRTRPKRPGGIITLLMFLLLVHGSQSFGQPVYRKEVVQSAILYSIAQFVEWPDTSFVSNNSPLRVCVFGEDLLQKELMKWQKRSYFGRPIEVIVLSDLTKLEKAVHQCQIIYIADNKLGYSNQILSLTKSSPILSVSDDDNFFKNGGVVSFVEVGGRVNFCLNLDNAARNGLQISSKLFGLSLSIIKNGTVMEQR